MATKIPPPPWTLAALDEDLYIKLALENGCYDPTGRPDLDLTAPYNEQQALASAKPAKNQAEKE